MKAGDFRDTANININHLRGYLDFAERGMAALTPITAGEGEPESPFEQAVLDLVRGWGYQVEPQVGHAGYRIDMAIRHPEKQGSWLLGIECDGAAYHSSRTARDRDRLRQEVLEGLGWNLHRIWGPAWYRDQRGCESRLRSAINDALTGTTTGPRARSAQFEVDIEEIDTAFTALPDWVAAYIAAQGQPDSRPKFATLSSARATSAFLPDVIKIVSIEGPVHRDVVVERLRLPYGAERTRSTFRTAVNAAIDHLVRAGQLDEQERGFLATSDAPTATVQVRCPTGEAVPQTHRTVEQVPPLEIRQAMINLVNDAQAIDEGELFVRVARIFGWGRNGPVITRTLGTQLTELTTRRQTLVKREGRISPASPTAD